MARTLIPSVVIGGTEFKGMANSATLEPNGIRTFEEDEWMFSIDVELTYGSGESWTVLDGFRDTVQTCVYKPDDGSVSATNPSATFTARIPAIPFASGAQRGDRQVFTLELDLEDPPTYATS